MLVLSMLKFCLREKRGLQECYHEEILGLEAMKSKRARGSKKMKLESVKGKCCASGLRDDMGLKKVSNEVKR